MACCGITLSNTHPVLHEFLSRVSAMADSKGIALVINNIDENEQSETLKIGAQNAKGIGELNEPFLKVVELALSKGQHKNISFDKNSGIVSLVGLKKAPEPKVKEKPIFPSETPANNGAVV